MTYEVVRLKGGQWAVQNADTGRRKGWVFWSKKAAERKRAELEKRGSSGAGKMGDDRVGANVTR